MRHPNIISVLDYGFDANRQLYFTMELLEQPQTLLNAARSQPLSLQVDLLVQTLQSLAYLHRRGIFHRDLKPENVLVSQGRVRVLDFGLSVLREQGSTAELAAQWLGAIVTSDRIEGRFLFLLESLSLSLENRLGSLPLAALLRQGQEKEMATWVQEACRLIRNLDIATLYEP